MKKYSFLLSLLAFGLLSSACESNYQSISYEKSGFAKMCENSGGVFRGGNKCRCLNNICDDGLVCNTLTKACPVVSLPETCGKGQTHCTNGKYYVCNEEYNWSVKDDLNCDSYGCLPDNSACAKCSKDVCENGQFITCKNGVIEKKETCLTGECENDTKCKGVCNEDEKTCKDNILYICKNEELVKEKECSAGCDITTNNTCASNCTEGEKYCADGNLKTCKNGVFDDKTSVSCDNGVSCKNDRECGDCKTGDSVCSDGKMKTCSNGVWSESVACTNEGSCKNDEECGECKNGDTICENDQVKTCTDGVWGEFAACPDNHSCKNDGKTCGECRNDETQCSDDAENVGSIKTCVAGQWDEGTPCKDDASCKKDEKTCGECRNGTDKCVEDSVQHLNNVGFVYQCKHGELVKKEDEQKGQCMDNYGNRNSCNSEHTDCGECLNGIDICFATESSINMYECVDGKRGNNIKKICLGGCSLARECQGE